jgi:type I restriction enzyme M protein
LYYSLLLTIISNYLMAHPTQKYTLEDHVNDWVKSQFDQLKLKNQQDYYTESAIPDYLKNALKGGAKTRNKTNFGKPDFSLTKYCNNKVPVIIENKLGVDKHIAENKEGVIKFDDKSIVGYAVNGALHYARCMIENDKYHEVIAVGIAADCVKTIAIKVYYVYGFGETSFKFLEKITTLDFLENTQTFNEFYKNATLTDDEKHDILISSQAELQKYAKSLNKLMHNHNITAPQRVLYVSGMLLSMQPVVDREGKKIQDGLTPDNLTGIQSDTKRDGVQIVNQITEFLNARGIPNDKKNLMQSSFSEISKAPLRDKETKLDKEISKLINGNASANKQIFTFIYHNIFLSIDAMAGHLDIMGEMYSEFLKYALGDGKEIGIVLTPPYITKMMADILNINQHSKVMDLATGSAGFLISAMEIMINQAETEHGKGTTAANNKIQAIKSQQLMGVELNAEMFTLAATNMILRGDGSSNIQSANTFETPVELYENFKANKLLLNPPFSYDQNGMPFIEFGLNKMEKGGLAAIIIQDSAGSGKAIKANQAMLKLHTLIASIKMPGDLFKPMAGVQTSVYIFKAHNPHDFEETVKFIDFRNDGYKRTSRALQEIDEPTLRYADIIKIYKAGKKAKVQAAWNLNDVFVEDFITNSGADWNFDQHKIIDTQPTFNDFRKTVADYLAWEVEQLLKQDTGDGLGK